MSQSKIKSSRSYTRHSADYKKEALRLAEVHGVSKAASDLKLSESQIYAWRVQAEQAKSISEREQELSLENVKLRTYARKTHNLLILFKNIKIGQFKQLVVFKWFFIEICVSPNILNFPH